MAVESINCFDRRGSFAEVRVKSEDSLATRTRAIWMAGDFLPIARSYSTGAGQFIDRLGVGRGDTLLDVACGTGNLAIPAAKYGARVYGIDIAPYLIAQARLEARAAGCKVDFDVGNVESLPFMDGLFDTTATMFGAMFSPRPEVTAAELIRVTRAGGRIAMANLTPDGFAGDYFRAHTSVLPPPPGLRSPLDWGQEENVRALFGDFVSSVTFARRTIGLRFPSPASAVSKLFASCYGPTVKALDELDPAGARHLRSEISRLFHRHNEAKDGTTAVSVEFLEVQARVA
jgi:ubiquinone/menaquinone biosynthesis C-methylase UbiE